MSMVFRVLLFVWEFLMDVLAVSRLSDEEKELELLLLRQHVFDKPNVIQVIDEKRASRRMVKN
jgi:hypothetical protein